MRNVHQCLGGYTKGRMGEAEALIAQCLCGLVWGLFAAQPLIILSATGPVLIFEVSLYMVRVQSDQRICFAQSVD